jgi:ATP-dependent DNA helicase RecQ
MCEKLPTNREEMLNVSGVGAAKYEKYGARFIEEIQNYQENHPDAVVSIKDFDIGDISR